MLKIGKFRIVSKDELKDIVAEELNKKTNKVIDAQIRITKGTEEKNRRLYFTIRDIEDYLESTEIKEFAERDIIAQHIKNKINHIIFIHRGNYRKDRW